MIDSISLWDVFVARGAGKVKYRVTKKTASRTTFYRVGTPSKDTEVTLPTKRLLPLVAYVEGKDGH